MELLLLACAWLVYTAGAQSEQAKVGLSPGQRDILKERTRHEKAVQRIADKHGVTPPATPASAVSPWKEAPAAGPAPTLPEAFGSGYRSHTPIERVATPMGRRAGGWAAQGVAWAKDTGRGAVREYRKRRKAAGHDDPAPVLEPVPLPPDAPPIPSGPPLAAGTDSGDGKRGVSLERPKERTEAAKPEGSKKPPEGATEPPAGADAPPGAPEASTGPETPPDGAGEAPVKEPTAPAPEASPGPEEAATGPETKDAAAEPESAAETKDTAEPKSSEEPPGTAETAPASAPAEPEATPAAPENSAAEPENSAVGPESPAAAPEGTTSGPIRDSEPASAGGGVGRMAAKVTYQSVIDESDELNLMCDEDFATYERIGTRCEREIGKGDSLIAELTARGAGSGLLAWITRCKEDYGTINSELGQLKQNTKAQGEKVVQAKALLEAGQGVYANQAKDMESVMDRDFYISDAVDSEDAAAHTEVYETRG
ncbi:hypothetical protein [Streptomyces violaceusniger]|uniref:Uncharacterized protein n=1 Tax=Streptomyces violaceusniger (strain Tu 4113) TaxID=653045 RepID=G2PGU6_STRV4|nr:hypothetical protein [Streptomyces violaceusniger]AEM88660.1 hypothetical protein Strvi_9403 [Streptomyces violaceusniger Tu 4113]